MKNPSFLDTSMKNVLSILAYSCAIYSQDSPSFSSFSLQFICGLYTYSHHLPFICKSKTKNPSPSAQTKEKRDVLEDILLSCPMGGTMATFLEKNKTKKTYTTRKQLYQSCQNNLSPHAFKIYYLHTDTQHMNSKEQPKNNNNNRRKKSPLSTSFSCRRGGMAREVLQNLCVFIR